MIYSPIIFGLGPSGVGKSHILELLAPEIGFFLLDLDTHRPFGRNGLRDEWHTFSTELNPQPLVTALGDRVTTENTAGIILSFPSTRILKSEHIDAAGSAGIRTVLLWGPEDLCRKASLGRNDGRVTTEAQYDKSNRRVFATYTRTEYDGIRVDTFRNGSRLPPMTIIDRIRPLIVAEQLVGPERGEHVSQHD